MQASDEFGRLCEITTQHYLGLPSFSSEVEKRINEREKDYEFIGYFGCKLVEVHGFMWWISTFLPCL